jgi:hypothetical protein
MFAALQQNYGGDQNIGRGDLPIAADALTNNLQIISHDGRFIDGLDKAPRGSKLRAILKANRLPDDIGQIFILPERSAL